MTSILVSVAFLFLTLIPPSLCQPESDLEPCPRWRLLGSEKIKQGAYGYEPLKYVELKPSTCAANKTKTFHRNGTFTTATLHQTTEGWNRIGSTRKGLVLSEIDAAINAGLDLFASHAGNSTHPLAIHITVADALLLRAPNPPFEIVYPDKAVTFNTWGRTEPQGIGAECELLVSWPYNASDSLVKLKKNIVNNMYLCVEQYHHPRLDWETYVPWWHHGIAYFFSSLLWPGEDEWNYDEGHYSTALWHWAHSTNGWSLERITSWMKARRIESIDNPLPNGLRADRQDMSQDANFTALFHSYVPAAAANKITYPSGAPVNNTQRYFYPYRSFLYSSNVKGEEMATPLAGTPVWYPVRVYNTVLPAGQVFDISAGHVDYVVLNGANVTIDRVANASVYGDVQISYCEAGKAKLGVELMEGGEARIAVPSQKSGGVEYEFFISCTGGTYQSAPLEFRVTRII
ncbi:hypothetical protein OQA88_10641 [Cercophora sp. LCS_1]